MMNKLSRFLYWWCHRDEFNSGTRMRGSSFERMATKQLDDRYCDCISPTLDSHGKCDLCGKPIDWSQYMKDK